MNVWFCWLLLTGWIVVCESQASTDPCSTVRCAYGPCSAILECDWISCGWKAVCYDPCQYVRCDADQTCSMKYVINDNDTSLSGFVPVCGTNPCDYNGVFCAENEGCYLEKESCSPLEMWFGGCRVRAVCRDPCQVVKIKCPAGSYCAANLKDANGNLLDEPRAFCKNPCENVTCETGMFCYSNEVQCIRAPCPPIAECQFPCDRITCQPTQKCETIYPSCLTGTYCPPTGYCVNQTSNRERKD